MLLTPCPFPSIRMHCQPHLPPSSSHTSTSLHLLRPRSPSSASRVSCSIPSLHHYLKPQRRKARGGIADHERNRDCPQNRRTRIRSRRTKRISHCCILPLILAQPPPLPPPRRLQSQKRLRPQCWTHCSLRRVARAPSMRIGEGCMRYVRVRGTRMTNDCSYCLMVLLLPFIVLYNKSLAQRGVVFSRHDFSFCLVSKQW